MNYIPEAHQTGSTKALLVPWPGSKTFSTITGANPRGIRQLGSVTYKISDTTLYSVDSLGTETSIGTIAGTQRCVLRDDGTNLIITTGSKWYQYDTSTPILTEFSPPTLSTGLVVSAGNSVDFLNGFAIYDVSDGKFMMSDFGDPDSIQSNNFATAESSPDDLKVVFVFNERAYLMGSRSIETWIIATGNPPLKKLQNGTMPVGLKDIHSVAASQNYVYFRGDDGWVYRFSSTQAINITSGFAANAFENFADDTAESYIVEIQGGTFYVISFTQNNRTFVFSERNHGLSPGVDDWFELSSGTDQDLYIGAMYTKAFNKHLIEKKGSGDILELDIDTYTDDGSTIVRVRETPPIHGGLLGKEGARLEMSWFEVIIKKGVGIASGQGSDPRIYIQGTFDGANSYSNQEEIEIGRTGDAMIKVKWYHTESFYEAAFRITGYDPVFYSIKGASIGIKFAGD
ncbi:MAG: hypothetical protein JKX91_06505 [Rhizobiaceae bacterium]|nr:hypothetical protein [Rhizobiaceae bacterium]